MKIGLVSDAHGNPDGLRSCLEYLQIRAKTDHIYFLGDAVGYLPAYNEVVELLRDADARCLMGNHDAMLLGRLPIEPTQDAVYQIANNRPELLPTNYRYMSEWPLKIDVLIDNRHLLFVHGTPWEPLTGYAYPDSELSRFKSLEFDAVFMGQSHRPFIRTAKNTLVVNIGSCGLPRDHGGMSSCAIYDTTSNAVRILRIPMKVDYICARFEGQMHSAVIDCMKRIPKSAIVGEIVE